MENKRDLTRELLAGCFHELMLTTPFDRITIKMITDRAGLIRPTFYKHFQDKYEVFEWIFKTDVTDSVDLLLENGMEKDAIIMFCRSLYKDRKFYRRAWKMEPGPNSFDQILTRYIYKILLNLTERYSMHESRSHKLVTRETIATYYTYGIVNCIRDWLISDNDYAPEDVADAFIYLFRHSAVDLLRKPLDQS